MSTHRSNWPQGTDYSRTNWTGRVPRTSDWGGHWAPDSHRIPASAWVGAAAVLGVLFVLLPVLGAVTGF